MPDYRVLARREGTRRLMEWHSVPWVGPGRALVRATLPLTLTPRTTSVPLLDDNALRAAYDGRHALIVGGTRGIGTS